MKEKKAKVLRIIIKENCDLRFYYNKTDIIPTVLDGGNKITLR